MGIGMVLMRSCGGLVRCFKGLIVIGMVCVRSGGEHHDESIYDIL